MMACMKRRNESGNILFLILLAVVLFAALSYAVTNSMRGGGKSASDESFQAGAANMLQQFAALDAAITRMRLSGGVPVENISFLTTRKNYDTSTQSAYGNSNCAAASCKIFDPAGGGVTDRNFEKYGTPVPSGSPAIAPGYWQMFMVQWPQAGTDANDVIMQYTYLRPGLCSALNATLGITAIPTTTGTYVAANNPANWDNAAYTIASNASSIIDKTTFATGVSGSGDGQNCFVYHLLIAR